MIQFSPIRVNNIIVIILSFELVDFFLVIFFLKYNENIVVVVYFDQLGATW